MQVCNTLEARPPPKKATFPTDVAAKLERAPLSCAVDQVPSARAEPTAAVGGAADWVVGAVPPAVATMAGASLPLESAASALEDILKPADTAA